MDKFSRMSQFDYNGRKPILNFPNNCYQTVQADCFSFRLRGHQIHTASQFTLFPPTSFCQLREHCEHCDSNKLSTSLNKKMTREKLLPGLSPNTAVGKNPNEHFILAKSVFFSLYSWLQQLQVMLQVMLSYMGEGCEDPLKF